MMTTLQHNYFSDAHLLWLVFNKGSLLRGVALKTATFHPVLCFFTVLYPQHFSSYQVANAIINLLSTKKDSLNPHS